MSKELLTEKTVAAQASDVAVQPMSIMQAITLAVSDPRIDVEKMERLLAMHERLMKIQAEKDFAESMNRLQARVPQIHKAGIIFNKDRVTVRSRYSLIEDIDKITRPMIAEEGFSISYNEEDINGNFRKFSATMLHKSGHSVTKYKTMPFDKSDFRTDAQSEASTTSLARRYLLKMHLNLIEAGDDDDGQASNPLTEDQVKDLNTLIKDCGADLAGFLRYMGVDALADIQRRDFKKAVTALDAKKRGRK